MIVLDIRDRTVYIIGRQRRLCAAFSVYQAAWASLQEKDVARAPVPERAPIVGFFRVALARAVSSTRELAPERRGFLVVRCQTRIV